MGHNGLDEGPVAIIQSYLQKEDHENSIKFLQAV